MKTFNHNIKCNKIYSEVFVYFKQQTRISSLLRSCLSWMGFHENEFKKIEIADAEWKLFRVQREAGPCPGKFAHTYVRTGGARPSGKYMNMQRPDHPLLFIFRKVYYSLLVTVGAFFSLFFFTTVECMRRQMYGEISFAHACTAVTSIKPPPPLLSLSPSRSNVKFTWEFLGL